MVSKEQYTPVRKRNTPAAKGLSVSSYLLFYLNRGYAYWSFCVNYILYGFLYLCLGGIPPTYNTRPKKCYNPSVFVTGAGAGIGRATALLLAKSGYTVFADVLESDEGNKLKAEYTLLGLRTGGSIHPIVCNVLSHYQIQDAVKQVTRFHGENPSKPFVGLVNNAGFCMISPMEFTSRRDIQRMVDLDLLAYIDTTRAFLPLLKQTHGRVVLIGSYGGYTPVPGWTTYNAVKAAVDNLARSWNYELTSSYGVRVTCVRPGWVSTEGIGPKIMSGIEEYDKNPDAVGFDSLGNVMLPEKGEHNAGMRKYRNMMQAWKKLVTTSTALGTPPEHVANTVRDALTEAWMQPCYTVAWDALLSQMARDFTPEPIYEWLVLKTLT